MRICFALVGCAAMAGSVTAQGADVIAGDITGPSFWGGLNGVSAYSIGTESCNIGDVDLLWDDTLSDGTPANLHPVMSQNMFRLKDGRFEQIGQSWLKHAFFAIQGSGLCAPVGECDPHPNGDALGPGCNDPYSSSLNGQQSGMGPKFEINAATGAYPWPFTGDGQTGNVLFKRIQVDNDDLDPAMNAGALYFGEGHYVTPDDAAAGNDNNNASYRRINVSSSLSSGGYPASFTGQTMRGSPAIQAWQDFDNTVVLNPLDVPNDGRFWIGYKTSDNGDGTWHYEYAIYNLNSDRSAGSFSVPIGNGVTVTNIGFHDVDYHSGEPFDNTDWTGSVVGNEVVWNSPADFNTDPNTNALRWGTLYNFRFDADAPPQSVDAVLGMFKPGAQADYNVPGAGPEGADCLADVNGDGAVTPTDFTAWVNAFNNNLPECDQNGDNACTPTDFTAWVNNFNAGC